MPAKNKKTHVWAWIFGCLGIFFLIGSLLTNIILGVALVSKESPRSLFFPETHDEVYLSGDPQGSQKIAVIEVKGPIFYADSYDLTVNDPSSVENLTSQIKQAQNDPQVKAIIFDINSPGGSTTAADNLYHLITTLKQETDLPIVAYYGEIAASGAVYMTLPADYIIGTPTGLTGSIGTILSTYNYEELLNKIGVKEIVIKSGEEKDIFSPTRPMTDQERDQLQTLVDQDNQRFFDLVRQNRELSQASLATIADGRIINTQQALEIGLIDEIGYFDQVVNKAKELSGIENETIIRYEIPWSFGGVFDLFDIFAQSQNPSSQIESVENKLRPQTLYLMK